MAFLPNLAGRLNDIEISANAPLTETVMRRVGSNINLLLDFLGLIDGSSSASGDLSDFINAVDLIRNHTMALQFTNPGNGSYTIGTYASIPFVDRIIWAENLNCNIVPGASSGGRIIPRISVDGSSPAVYVNHSINTPTNTALTGGGIDKVGGTRTTVNAGSSTANSADFYGRSFDGVLGVTGYAHRMRNTQWTRFADLSWRDGNSTVLSYYNEGANGIGDPCRFYLQYKLNLESAFLVAP